MIVVSDTTPLNYLVLIKAIAALPTLFGRVFAPGAVIAELTDPRAPASVRAWASEPPSWLAVREPTHLDATLPGSLHAGEVHAISLARELGADWVLIDERKASRAAERCGLRVAGTLVILEEAGARGLLDYPAVRDRLVQETNFFVSDDVLRDSERRYQARKQAWKRENPKPFDSDATEQA